MIGKRGFGNKVRVQIFRICLQHIHQRERINTAFIWKTFFIYGSLKRRFWPPLGLPHLWLTRQFLSSKKFNFSYRCSTERNKYWIELVYQEEKVWVDDNRFMFLMYHESIKFTARWCFERKKWRHHTIKECQMCYKLLFHPSKITSLFPGRRKAYFIRDRRK